MSYRTLKQYKDKDILKVCDKNNLDQLPSQFDESVFKTWNRLIALKNGNWIFQSDEINEEYVEDLKNPINKIFFDGGTIMVRSDHKIYNESATISFTNRRSYDKK